MADVKFNFYNTYSNYYKDINYLYKFNLFMKTYDYTSTLFLYLFEVVIQLFCIKLLYYIKYECLLTQRTDYNIFKSLKHVNKNKIILKTIFQNKNCFFRIYNLIKF